MSKNSFVDQINQLKGRDEFSRDRRFYKRFEEIDNLISELDNHRIKEIRAVLKYIPITIVACLEGYFRSMAKELIDFGNPYLQTVIDLEKKLPIKLTFEVLIEIKSQTISVGELVALMLPCNKLEDIDSIFSIILDKSFLESLKIHHRKSDFDARLKAFKHFKDNHAEIYSDIRRLFELRHILCHEIAYQLDLDQSEILRCYSNVKLFFNHTTDFFSYCLDPDEPEAVSAVVERKRQQSYLITDTVLELIAKEKIVKQYDEHIQKNFEETYDEAVESWKVYRDAKAKNASSKTVSATWGSYAYCQSIIDSSKTMIENITKTGQFP